MEKNKKTEFNCFGDRATTTDDDCGRVLECGTFDEFAEFFTAVVTVGKFIMLLFDVLYVAVRVSERILFHLILD